MSNLDFGDKFWIQQFPMQKLRPDSKTIAIYFVDQHIYLEENIHEISILDATFSSLSEIILFVKKENGKYMGRNFNKEHTEHQNINIFYLYILILTFKFTKLG